MPGDNPKDTALQASWDDFCDQLKSAGDIVFRDTTAGSLEKVMAQRGTGIVPADSMVDPRYRKRCGIPGEI